MKRKVLIISDGDDMAGVNNALKRAFDRHSTRYQMRQVRGTDNYIKYPVDIPWWGNNTLVNRLYDAADLIHISEYPWALDGGSAPKIWERVPKPTVVHQHGTPFRNSPSTYLRLARQQGFTQIVSTVDLLIDESLTWLPNPVNIDRMQEIRRENYIDDGQVRLGHGPTNRSIKNTAEYIEAARQLGVDYLLIEGTTWDISLREKARVDVWYDQLTFGYGNNGIEAAAMGIPVVGGWSNPEHRQRYVQLVGAPPIVEATVSTLGQVLADLVHNHDYRKAEADRCLATVRRVHGEANVVALLEKIYDRTIDEFEARNV